VATGTRSKSPRVAGRRQAEAADPAGSGDPDLRITNAPRRRALDLLIRPTRAEVDLDALRRNVAAVRNVAPSAEILAVVKANAYGHGAAVIARALEEERVGMLGVALIEEAIELRNAGIRAPILVLGGSYEGGYDLLVAHQLTPTIFRPEHAQGFAQAARRAERPVDVHLKVDSGMGRIGVLPEELDSFLDLLVSFPEIRVDGLLSHFASADLENREFTQAQVRCFKDAHARMRARGLRPRWRHLSNSAGVIDLPEVRDGLELNMVRPGIMLYGLYPAEHLRGATALEPVLSWKTAVIHLKRVAAGTPISYGSTWRAPRESAIATLPIGYADGYSRRYSNRSQVLVRGRRAPLVGRVCMDMCMADVTDIPGVRVGDEVVLLGSQGAERIGAEELAALAETIHYEVICAVGARVPRVGRGQGTVLSENGR
jgi:alanine racemase